MRIDYLINGLNGGGAAFPVIDVVGLMRECGHEVRVIALMPQDGRAASRLTSAGIRLEVIGGGTRHYLAHARGLLRCLRQDRPQLLWTSLSRATIYGQLAGRLLGIPVVSWQHNAFLKPGNLAILRRTRSLTRHWVADSQAVKRFAQERLGIDPQAIDIWPLFISHPEVPQATPWTAGQKFRIGSLGRLHPNKQYEVLVQVAARVRALAPALSAQLEFVIGGAGREADALVALALSLGVENLRFAGFVEAPAAFLAGLHAYIQPSRNEGLCLAAHEAMQAALPVIATPVGEIAYSVLSGETGWLCGIGDVEAMAQAVLALMRDPARAAQMGQAGRARVLDRFGAARFAAAGRQILARAEGEIALRS